MTEGKIVSWIKFEGDVLTKGESVIVVESDKVDMDVETFYNGYLAAIIVKEGGVATMKAEITEAKAKANSSSSVPTTASTTQSAPEKVAKNVGSVPSPSLKALDTGGKRIVASPCAKKLAKELKLDLGRIVGSGSLGKIVVKDVEAAAVAAVEATTMAIAVPTPGSGATTLPVIELGSVVPLSTMQGAMSKNMVKSLTVPTFRVRYTITTDAFDALYKKTNGVTMKTLLAKAIALALAKHPMVNSSCWDGNNFIYNSSINIAVAVTLDGGLITLVLQDANKRELVDKAKAKQLHNVGFYAVGLFILFFSGLLLCFLLLFAMLMLDLNNICW
ncbi:hypothetical protein UlMin_005014 [Ulmus minor]